MLMPNEPQHVRINPFAYTYIATCILIVKITTYMFISSSLVSYTFTPLFYFTCIHVVYMYVFINKTSNIKIDKLCVLQRPPITEPCTTLPPAAYYIHAIVTNGNDDASERIYTSNRIDDSVGGAIGTFIVSYNDNFDQELEPNANYAFVVNTQDIIIEIPRTDTSPSCGK